MKNFEAYFTEMALTDFKKIGDWNNKKNRQGYDKQSLGILNSEAGVKKIQSAFNKIKDWDFNLYFLKKNKCLEKCRDGNCSTRVFRKDWVDCGERYSRTV
jgi:hypothetical protein